jgi:hypothetical protein
MVRIVPIDTLPPKGSTFASGMFFESEAASGDIVDGPQPCCVCGLKSGIDRQSESHPLIPHVILLPISESLPYPGC